VERGEEYTLRGCVRDMDVSDHGHTVQGHVEDGGSVMQSVFINMDDAGIEGDCSCPVGYNCEHVAAMLLAMLDDRTVSPGKAANMAKRAGQAVSQHQSDSGGSHERSIIRAAYPDDVHQRILYILRPEPQSCHIGVDVVSARCLDDGSYCKIFPYLLRNFFNHVLHRFVLPVDVAIAQRMGHPDTDRNSFLATGSSGAELMTWMLDTGRCHWLDANQPPLTPGEERRGTWRWHIGEQALQQLVLAVPDTASAPDMASASMVIPTTPPFYMDDKTMQCGPIATDCSDDLYESLH